MPRTSERKGILTDIDNFMIQSWLEGDEEFATELAEISVLISSHRFIERGQKRRRESHYFQKVFFDLPDVEFRAMFRTTKEGFTGVLNIIQDNPIFHNSSTFQQRDPIIQLAVALARFGSYGNGGSVSKLQSIFQFGYGSTINYTKRVIKALTDVQHDWINWPTPERRAEIGQVMREEGFPGCVGFIDGTTINLSQKPAHNGETYFDRKKR